MKWWAVGKSSDQQVRKSVKGVKGGSITIAVAVNGTIIDGNGHMDVVGVVDDAESLKAAECGGNSQKGE